MPERNQSFAAYDALRLHVLDYSAALFFCSFSDRLFSHNCEQQSNSFPLSPIPIGQDSLYLISSVCVSWLSVL